MNHTETPEGTLRRRVENLSEIRDKLEGLGDSIDVELAVEVLEYHNKNLLVGDNESRSRERMSRLQFCNRRISELKALTK